jgi:hypothetical protein
MSQSTFRELLKYTTETAPKPPVLADGHYIGTLKDHEFGVSRQKQTPFVTWHLGAEEECSDVAPGANEGVNLADCDLRKTLYITPKAVRRIGVMLDAVLGADAGRSFDERIPDTRGVRVMFGVTKREVKDESGNVIDYFNDVGDVIKA